MLIRKTVENSNRPLSVILIILVLCVGLYGITNVFKSNWTPILFVLFAILAVTAVFINLNTLLCIITIIAAFNFANLLYSPIGPRTGGQPVYMLVIRDILLLLLLINWFVRRVSYKERLHISLAISTPLFVYCFYIIIRSAGTLTALLASIRYLRYLVIYPLVLISIVPYAFQNKRDVKRFLWVFVSTGFVVSIIGIVEALTDFGDTYQNYGAFRTYYADGRASSTLGNPNNLAAYLGMVIGVALSLSIEGVLKSRFLKLFIILLICVALTCLFLTFSRGGILAITVTTMLLFGNRGIENRKLSLFMSMVIVIFIGLAMIYYTTQERKENIQELYTQGRAEYFWSTADYLFSNPFQLLVGRGIAVGYEASSVGLVKDVGSTEADNFFTLIWMESGSIGLILFLLLLFVILKEIVRIYRRQSDPYLKAGCSAVLSSVIYVTMWGISSVSFRLFPAGYYVWMFVGLAIAIERIE